MKILFILHSHECGGAEKHALLLMAALVQQGHEVIFGGPRDSWLGDNATALGIRIIDVPLKGLFDLYSLFKLVTFVWAMNIDLVHGHLVRGASYAAWVGRLSGRASLATAHATSSFKHFSSVNHIIAVSDAVRDFLISKGYPSNSITTVHHGVPDQGNHDANLRSEIRQQLGINDSDIALCMVARFIRDKGQDLLVEAVHGIENANIRVVLIGKDDTDWGDHVRSLVADYGLDNAVMFLGHREDVARLLSAMDILIVPSRREALSLSIIEACSARLPIIAARVGGIPEVVHDNVNGLIFPSEDVAALSAAITRLAQHPEVMEKMSRQARRIYEQDFSMDSMLHKTLGLYDKLLKK